MKNNFSQKTIFFRTRYLFLASFTYLVLSSLLILGNQDIVRAQEPAEKEFPVSSILAIPEDGTAIVVDKKTQTLFVYEPCLDTPDCQNTPAQKVLTIPCATGEEPGPKVQQGDKKTPEGIYFLTDEYEDKYLSPVYGKKAFPTDYPHILDRQQGKSGSAIWIHGTDKPLKPMSSNGCVALDNHNVMTLAKEITLNKTPVILTDQIRVSSPEEILAQKQQAENLIQSWLYALQSGSYHEYLACYSDSYLPDMFWWNQWRNFRESAQKAEKNFSFQTRNMGLYQHKDLIVAIMDLYLKTENASIFLGTRKLFLQKTENTIVISGDTYQTKPSRFAKDPFPLVAAANEILEIMDNQTEILQVQNTVKNWLHAWSSKDMKAYGEFYAPEFTADGLSKREWLHRKKNLAQRYKNIQVTGEQFVITRNKNVMVVRFFQKYHATGFSTDGFKELKLAHIGGSWKIFQEIWKGK